MELRQLKYFVKTAETLNFSEAARALFITQSTLSQQIRCLEQELGVELLQRDSHSVALTESGEHLLIIIYALFGNANPESKVLALVVGKGEVFQNGHVRAGTHGGVLVNTAYLFVAHEILLLVDALAAYKAVATVDGNRAADYIEHRGLAAAVAADDGDKLTVLDGKLKVFKQTHFGDVTLPFMPPSTRMMRNSTAVTSFRRFAGSPATIAI